MNGFQTMDWGDVVRSLVALNARPDFKPVHAGLSLAERFQNIRFNYAEHQARVDLGLASWGKDDVYALGNWVSLFTPIEAAVWSDIRSAGLPMWPQLPVGRFYVDFGNPVAKLAIECDGKEWHDAAKDAERDRIMLGMGWTVLRAPGWRCKRVIDIPDPEDWNYRSQEEQREFIRHRDENTMAGIIKEARWLLQNYPEVLA